MHSENESNSLDASGSPTDPAHQFVPHTTPGLPANSRKQNTSLFIAGPTPFNASSYAEPTSIIPPPSPSSSFHDAPTIPPPPPPYREPRRYIMTPAQAWKNQSSIAVWLLIAFPWLLVALLVVSLISMNLQSQPAVTSSGQTTSGQTATSKSTPMPTQTNATNAQTTRSATYSSTTNAISILPTQFNARTDCQPDNGYRCTATVFVSAVYHGNLAWQAVGDGTLTKFSPGMGTFIPGQQQQVIIYIHNRCPTSGGFTFSTGDNQVIVPWNC